MAIEVLLCIIMIAVLVVEIVKFFKKTYEWQSEYEIDLEKKYSDETRASLEVMNTSGLREREQQAEAAPKESAVPVVIKVEEILKNKLPQLAILAINVVMLASYEFVTISAYIVLVLVVIGEVLGLKDSEHINLRFILDLIAKLLIIAWYVNIFTVAKPSATESA